METALATILKGATSSFLGNIASKAFESVDYELSPQAISSVSQSTSLKHSVPIVIQILNIQAPQTSTPDRDSGHRIIQGAKPRQRKQARAKAYLKRITFDMQRSLEGMTIIVDLSLCGLSGVDCGLAIYPKFQNGTCLGDTNGLYCSSDGAVAVGVELTPTRREHFFPSISLFIPYSELHLAPGNYHLGLYVRAYRRSTNRTLASVLLQTELEKPGEWLTYKAIATESKI